MIVHSFLGRGVINHCILRRCFGDIPLEILALVANVFEFFLGDDLRHSDRDDRLATRRPDESPGASRDSPEALAGEDVDEGKRVVSVLCPDGYEETGACGGIFRGLTNAPATHDLVSVVVENRQICFEHVPVDSRRTLGQGRLLNGQSLRRLQ